MSCHLFDRLGAARQMLPKAGPGTEQLHDLIRSYDKECPMNKPKGIEDFDFGGAATYQIVVQGTVEKNWHSRLSGMVVTTSSQKTGVSQTTLRGAIRDQAALHGVIEILYALHLPILEVKKVDTHCDQDPTEKGG